MVVGRTPFMVPFSANSIQARSEIRDHRSEMLWSPVPINFQIGNRQSKIENLMYPLSEKNLDKKPTPRASSLKPQAIYHLPLTIYLRTTS